MVSRLKPASSKFCVIATVLWVKQLLYLLLQELEA